MTVKVILLDVDGTLIDSNELHVDAWREAFRRCGKELTREQIHAQMGKGGDMLVEALLTEEEAKRIGKEVVELHLELFVGKYQPREQALPGVRELLQRMKADGVRVVLASSAKEKELKGHLEVLGIDDLIDGSTTADAADHSKPCPDIFEAALELAGNAKPDEALVIGDSPWDAVAAKKAGIPMIGVLTGGFEEDELREKGARAVFRDLRELRIPTAG